MNESKVLSEFTDNKTRINDDEVSDIRGNQLTLKCTQAVKVERVKCFNCCKKEHLRVIANYSIEFKNDA